MKAIIEEAIRAPDKVLPYLRERLAPYYYRYLRSPKASMYRFKEVDGVPSDEKEAIHRTIFGELLSQQNDNEYRNFRTYLKVCDFAHYFNCSSILEIGAGYSTAIWAEYARSNGSNVTSVDIDFDLLERRVGDTKHERAVHEHVNLIEGASIFPEELKQFYSNRHSVFSGVEVAEFDEDLDHFSRAQGAPANKKNVVNRFASSWNWSVEDLIVSDGEMYFPERLLDSYVSQDGFEAHLEAFDTAARVSVLDDIKDQAEWDLIWFDSGEISSMVEWSKLKRYIEPGGLAAFHDIFFPKSMKNFVICTSLLHDPKWEVLLVDASTRQGLLVARRIDP